MEPNGVTVTLSENRQIAQVEVGGRAAFCTYEQLETLLVKSAATLSLMRRPWFAGVPGTVLPPMMEAA